MEYQVNFISTLMFLPPLFPKNRSSWSFHITKEAEIVLTTMRMNLPVILLYVIVIYSSSILAQQLIGLDLGESVVFVFLCVIYLEYYLRNVRESRKSQKLAADSKNQETIFFCFECVFSLRHILCCVYNATRVCVICGIFKRCYETVDFSRKDM